MSARCAWLLAAALALAGCAGEELLSERFEGAAHTVQPGDTLYAIAWRYNLNHRDLIQWNAIGPPFTIYPGQQIRLRPARARGASSTSLLRLPGQPEAPGTPRAEGEGTVPVPAAARAGNSDPRPAVRVTAAPAVDPPGAARVPDRGDWLWPTEGNLVGRFRPGSKSAAGVDIAGSEGQPVVASAPGTVVYSGSGIPSYGRLLIVKHSEEYLSAYAHNRKLLVSEGERVAGGQPIAEMGRDTDARVMLHFEIRRQGKPVDPLTYLARRP